MNWPMRPHLSDMFGVSAKNTWRRIIGSKGTSGGGEWEVQDLEDFGTVLAPVNLFQNILIPSADAAGGDASYLFVSQEPQVEAQSVPFVGMGVGGSRLTMSKTDGVFSLVVSYGEATSPFALYLDRDSGKVSFCPNLPEYADDAAADSDTLLMPGALYKLAGGRAIYQKP